MDHALAGLILVVIIATPIAAAIALDAAATWAYNTIRRHRSEKHVRRQDKAMGLTRHPLHPIPTRHHTP